MSNFQEAIKAEVKSVLVKVILFLLYYVMLILIGIGLFVVAIYVTCEIPSMLANLEFISIRDIILGGGFFLAMWLFCIQIGWYLIKPLFVFPKNRNDDRLEIKEKDCPELFGVIRDIAGETQNGMPKHVYMSSEANAAVFYDTYGIWSILFPPAKNLMIGMGLFVGMSKGELKAVLCHEFGHFSQKSMRIGLITYRLLLIIEGMINFSREQQEYRRKDWLFHLASWPIDFITGKTIALYNYIEKSKRDLSRYMEFEADSIAGKIAGTDNMISALCKLEILSDRYESFERILISLLHDKKYLTEYGQGYLFLLINGLLSEDESLNISFNDTLNAPVGDKAKHLSLVTIKDGWNSHPSLAERIDNLRYAIHNETEIVKYDASLMVPDDIFNKMGIIHQMYLCGHMDEPIAWNQVSPMPSDAFNSWALNQFENNRIPHFVLPFVNRNIIPFEIPDESKLNLDDITTPFTKKNRDLLLDYYQAIEDEHTLRNIQEEGKKHVHFIYNNEVDNDIIASLDHHNIYLDSFKNYLSSLDINIYKYLWNVCDNRQHLNTIYRMMFYSYNQMFAMRPLYQVADSIISQLELYNQRGVYDLEEGQMRIKPEVLEALFLDFKSFMGGFNYKAISDYCGDWVDERNISIKTQLEIWQDFIAGKEAYTYGSSAHKGVIYRIKEVWQLLNQIFIDTQNEWKRLVTDAYKKSIL